jgi:hypothetical protein
MDTSVCQSPLVAIEAQLQTALQQQDAAIEDLVIRCAVRRRVVMILGQHPAYAVADPIQLLDQLEQAVAQLPPHLLLASLPEGETRSGAIATAAPIPVQLYLRMEGQQRPYQSRRLRWLPLDAAGDASTMAQEGHLELDSTPDDFVSDASASDGSALESDHFDHSNHSDHADDPDAIAANDEVSALAIAPFFNASSQEADPSSPAAEASEADEAEEAEEEEFDREAFRSSLGFRLAGLPWGFLASGVIGVLAFTGAFYALTRPCVIGPCEPIAEAETLSQEALESLAEEPTAQTVQTAHSQVQKADQLLQSIPPWSRHRRQAQEMRQFYQQQAADLNQVMDAQQIAIAAAAQSQDPPHPISHWQDVRQQWANAIAQLASIPADSDLHDFVQNKLTEYRVNRAAIDRRIEAEQEASEHLQSAIATAETARLERATVSSLGQWQQLVSHWQQALNSLNRIPQGTMAYSEAQQLATVYDQKLTEAQTQYTQERLSAEAYRQATDQAQQAQRYEQQNQWTLAVNAWRQATSGLRQVQEGTAAYGDAQASLEDYRMRLSQAETNLRAAVALNKIRQQLQKTCTGSPTICTYAVSSDLIKVHLTEAYNRTVQERMVAAALRRDQATQQQITQHVDTLLQALTTIGANAGIPLELYDAQGSSLGRYSPTTSVLPR